MCEDPSCSRQTGTPEYLLLAFHIFFLFYSVVITYEQKTINSLKVSNSRCKNYVPGLGFTVQYWSGVGLHDFTHHVLWRKSVSRDT
jgi:hypothetical protein